MGRLRHMELMDHVGGDLFHRAHLGIDKDIRLAIERLAGGQELMNAPERIGPVQQRAVVVRANAFVDGFGARPKGKRPGRGS